MELFWTDRYNADKKLWDKLITSKKGACPKICMLINPWFLGIEGVFTATFPSIYGVITPITFPSSQYLWFLVQLIFDPNAKYIEWFIFIHFKN